MTLSMKIKGKDIQGASARNCAGTPPCRGELRVQPPLAPLSLFLPRAALISAT